MLSLKTPRKEGVLNEHFGVVYIKSSSQLQPERKCSSFLHRCTVLKITQFAAFLRQFGVNVTIKNQAVFKLYIVYSSAKVELALKKLGPVYSNIIAKNAAFALIKIL